MKRFEEFPREERIMMVNVAREWSEKHKRLVQELVQATRDSVSPSGSDCLRPELWKGCHWKWFFEWQN